MGTIQDLRTKVGEKVSTAINDLLASLNQRLGKRKLVPKLASIATAAALMLTLAQDLKAQRVIDEIEQTGNYISEVQNMKVHAGESGERVEAARKAADSLYSHVLPSLSQNIHVELLIYISDNEQQQAKEVLERYVELLKTVPDKSILQAGKNLQNYVNELFTERGRIHSDVTQALQMINRGDFNSALGKVGKATKRANDNADLLSLYFCDKVFNPVIDSASRQIQQLFSSTNIQGPGKPITNYLKAAKELGKAREIVVLLLDSKVLRENRQYMFPTAQAAFTEPVQLMIQVARTLARTGQYADAQKLYTEIGKYQHIVLPETESAILSLPNDFAFSAVEMLNTILANARQRKTEYDTAWKYIRTNMAVFTAFYTESQVVTRFIFNQDTKNGIFYHIVGAGGLLVQGNPETVSFVEKWDKHLRKAGYKNEANEFFQQVQGRVAQAITTAATNEQEVFRRIQQELNEYEKKR